MHPFTPLPDNHWTGTCLTSFALDLCRNSMHDMVLLIRCTAHFFPSDANYLQRGVCVCRKCERNGGFCHINTGSL